MPRRWPTRWRCAPDPAHGGRQRRAVNQQRSGSHPDRPTIRTLARMPLRPHVRAAECLAPQPATLREVNSAVGRCASASKAVGASVAYAASSVWPRGTAARRGRRARHLDAAPTLLATALRTGPTLHRPREDAKRQVRPAQRSAERRSQPASHSGSPSRAPRAAQPHFDFAAHPAGASALARSVPWPLRCGGTMAG